MEQGFVTHTRHRRYHQNARVCTTEPLKTKTPHDRERDARELGAVAFEPCVREREAPRMVALKEGREEERQGAEEAKNLGAVAFEPCVRERAQANRSQPQKLSCRSDL